MTQEDKEVDESDDEEEEEEEEKWYVTYSDKYELFVMRFLAANFSASNVVSAVSKSFEQLLGNDIKWKKPDLTYVKRVRRRLQFFEQLWQFIRVARSKGMHLSHDGSDINGEHILCMSGMLDNGDNTFSPSIISPGLIAASGSSEHQGQAIELNLQRGEEMINDLWQIMNEKFKLKPSMIRKLLKIKEPGDCSTLKMVGYTVMSDNANGAVAVSKYLRNVLYEYLPDSIKEKWDEMTDREKEMCTMLILTCWAHLRHLQEKEGMATLNVVSIYVFYMFVCSYK